MAKPNSINSAVINPDKFDIKRTDTDILTGLEIIEFCMNRQRRAR